MKNSINAYLIWFIITLFVVYAFILNTAGAVFAETFKTHLHLSTSGAAFAVGSFICGFACMQIPAGYLLDRFPLGIVAGGGLFLLASGNVALTLSSDLPLFALANFIQGVGASFAFIAAGKLIGEWFVAKLFPILFGLTQTLSCLSAALVHYFLVKALLVISWKTIYYEFSLFGFALLIVTLLFVKGRQKRELNKRGTTLSSVLKNKQVWICALAAATSFGTLLAYGSYWYLEVQKRFALDTSNSLMISGMIFLGIGMGTPFFGWLSNRIHSRKRAIYLSTTPGILFLVAELYSPFFTEIVSFCIGFFLSGSMLYYTCVSEISSNETRAVALGLINMSVFLFTTFLYFIPSLWMLPLSLLISLILGYFVRESCPQ